jgi:hypothetical protein
LTCKSNKNVLCILLAGEAGEDAYGWQECNTMEFFYLGGALDPISNNRRIRFVNRTVYPPGLLGYNYREDELFPQTLPRHAPLLMIALMISGSCAADLHETLIHRTVTLPEAISGV